jgi:hypothetical protein
MRTVTISPKCETTRTVGGGWAPLANLKIALTSSSDEPDS